MESEPWRLSDLVCGRKQLQKDSMKKNQAWMGIKPMTLWSYRSVLTNWAINPIQSKSTVSMFFVVFCQLFKWLNSEGVFSQNESSTVHSLVGVRVRWLRAKHFCVWPNQTLSLSILSHNEFKTFTFQIALQEQGSIVVIAGLYGLFQPLSRKCVWRICLLSSHRDFVGTFVWRAHTWPYGSFDK